MLHQLITKIPHCKNKRSTTADRSTNLSQYQHPMSAGGNNSTFWDLTL
uniref:Uncharacterized protein n=1 Tax=Zea mays TaxID=4577 RepID=C0HFS5_MAIZE|nr:unknown [Zea mays]